MTKQKVDYADLCGRAETLLEWAAELMKDSERYERERMQWAERWGLYRRRRAGELDARSAQLDLYPNPYETLTGEHVGPVCKGGK